MQYESKKVLVIGEVTTDLHLDIDKEKGPLVRIGGIFHAARALNSCNTNYALAYFAPSYMENSIKTFSSKLGADCCYELGLVEDSPNIILVSESTEAGSQGYYDILRSQKVIKDYNMILKCIDEYKPTDIILYPGKYRIDNIIEPVLNSHARLHIDFHYDSDDIIEIIKKLKKSNKIYTCIVSTSSEIFKDGLKDYPDDLIKYFSEDICINVLVKENRGGSRLFNHKSKEWINSPAFPTRTVHSVGVGDCFNAIFVSVNNNHNAEYALKFASYCASIYASTFLHTEFLSLVDAAKKIEEKIILEIKGISLPWEMRSRINIYLAAPDFPNVDTTNIDRLYENLKYHNFSPHLPVRENGLIKGNEDEDLQDSAFERDLDLLNKCNILIAILLYDDPGTLLELGMFAQTGKPTILYDPFSIAHNLFLRKLPNKWCKTIGEVIDSVYELMQ